MSRWSRIRRTVWVVAAVVALLCVWLAAANCHGHVIKRVHAPNLGRDFDFSEPQCNPDSDPPTGGPGETVLVRYLASGGLYVSWGDVGILTAPFFSNPGLLRVGLCGRVRWRDDAINNRMAKLPVAPRAVFAGHSHYDHVGDLVPILQRHARHARLYVGASGRRMLAPYPDLHARSTPLRATPDWQVARDARGDPLPLRFRAIRSRHAPHLGQLHFFGGRLDRDWRRKWPEKNWNQFREGEVFAFVFDLLDQRGRVRFRLYANDTASPRGWGVPDRALARERRFDLAALVMASYYLVDDYPEQLLESLWPRHVLAIHYEDFFQSLDRQLRFVPMLTNARANRFLERVGEAVLPYGRRPPLSRVCGPSGTAVTMAMPGQWLRFRAGSEKPAEEIED